MKIYKYTPHINSFLNSSALKLTPIRHLNDPFEAKVAREFLDNLKEHNKKIFKNHYDKIFKNFDKNIDELHSYEGVVSLSKKNLDILMLSHYASNHEGGILEFEINELDCHLYNENDTNLFTSVRDNYFFGEVKYKKERQLDVTADIKKYLLSDIYFEKYSDWQHEEEIRYVSDFRFPNYIILPKYDLVKHCLEENNVLKAIGLHSWDIDGDYYYYYYPDHENDGRIIKSKKYKIINIAKKLFSEDLAIYNETDSNIEIHFKEEIPKEPYSNYISSWRKLIQKGIIFHPMLNVNSDSLTGLYLGCKFNLNSIKKSTLSKFKNLNDNIVKATPCQNTFTLTLRNVINDLA